MMWTSTIGKVAPGWNVIGGGEPALPGVSVGHNEAGAWGLTIFGTNSEDLYVYDTNPANPLEYKYAGGWEAMKVIRESIPVKGEAPRAVELKYTRHGPVVFEDKPHHKAYAVRAAWRETGLVFCHEDGTMYPAEALNWRFSRMTRRPASATGTLTRAATPPFRS